MLHALLLAAMVVIRSYNYADVPPDTLAQARSTAIRIFEHAGIELKWVDCETTSSIVDRREECAVPLREGAEFVLRLRTASPQTITASPRHFAMGSTVVDHDSGIGAVTTVDPSLVSSIARTASTDYPTLLGRAIAHEIGHLLLGHSRHSRDGLMRAIWSQEELRGIRPAGWQFSGAEAAQMRHGLAGRARAAN